MSTRPALLLVGRPEEPAAPYLEVLRERGVEAQAYPLVQPHTVPLDAEARAVLERLQDFRWALFASRNAVAHFFQALGGDALPPVLRCGAVGPATRAALEEHGVAVACTPAAGTGRALADEVLALGEEPASHPVLLVGARGGRPEMHEAMRAAGHPVARLELYESLPVAGAAPAPGAVVLLFSPSASRALAARVGDPAGQRVWAIGPTTAAAARAAGFALERVLVERTPESLRLALET